GRARAPRHGRCARPPGGPRGRLGRGRQRRASRRAAGPPDAARRGDRAARLGRAAPRRQHAAARRDPPDRRAQARAMTHRMIRRLPAAIGIAVVAFALYDATLLPSFDFGDTGFFQATVGSPALTPRDGYPLYFAIGNLLVRWTHIEPARILNLASAVEAGIACGLVVLVSTEISGSVLAG